MRSNGSHCWEMLVPPSHLRAISVENGGLTLTAAATVVERFRRPSFGRMEIDITVDDPNAYTEPWTVRVNQSLMLDQELIEFVCLENQRFGQ